jgi:hypothetical protein
MIWNSQPNFGAVVIGSSVFRLCCLTLMGQALVLDGVLFDASHFG